MYVYYSYNGFIKIHNDHTHIKSVLNVIVPYNYNNIGTRTWSLIIYFDEIVFVVFLRII